MNPTSGYAGMCEPADQPVVSSLIATLASQVWVLPESFTIQSHSIPLSLTIS